MFKLKNAVSVILNGVYGVKNLWTLARKILCLCIQIIRPIVLRMIEIV